MFAEICSIYQYQRDFKKEIIMSSSIDFKKMQDFLDKVKSSTNSSGWKSRKLWITIATVTALLFLFKATLTLVLWQVTVLIGLYIVTQAAVDVAATIAKARVKVVLIESLSKDGLTSEEVDLIEKSNE